MTITLQQRSAITNIKTSSSSLLIVAGPVHFTWGRECDKDRGPI